MRRFSEQLLAVLLALLLGLSPLQGVMAGFTSSPDQEAGAQPVSEGHDCAMHVSKDRASHDCEQHDAGTSCTGHGCFAGQCGSCATALLPAFSYHTILTATPGLPRTDEGFPSHRPSPLFRPPRA